MATRSKGWRALRVFADQHVEKGPGRQIRKKNAGFKLVGTGAMQSLVLVTGLKSAFWDKIKTSKFQ